MHSEPSCAPYSRITWSLRTAENVRPDSDLVGMRQTLVGVFPQVDHRRVIPKKVHLCHASPDRGTYRTVQVYFPARAPPYGYDTPLCKERVVLHFDTQR